LTHALTSVSGNGCSANNVLITKCLANSGNSLEKLGETFLVIGSCNWVIPEKIHTPHKEEISGEGEKNVFLFSWGRGEKFVSDNSKYIKWKH
jgi:hypothetical protein